MNETTVELASRWKRLGGSLIDLVVVLVATIPVGILLFTLDLGINLSEFHKQVSMLVASVAFYIVVNGHLLSKYGQTVGKRVVGTRIVSYTDGQLLPLSKILALRFIPISLLCQIPFIGGLIGLINALFIFGKERRCLHDLMAGTKVVNA